MKNDISSNRGSDLPADPESRNWRALREAPAVSAIVLISVITGVAGTLVDVVSATNPVRDLLPLVQRVLIPALAGVASLSLVIVGMYGFIVRGRKSAQRLAEARHLLKSVYRSALVSARFISPDAQDEE